MLKVLSNSNILLQSVLAYFTYLFQPVDVQCGPNGFVKRLIKNKSSDSYAAQITHAMDDGRELDSIDIELKLLNEVSWRKRVCLKGWEDSGEKGALELRVTKLPNLDPFDDINPMLERVLMIYQSMILLQYFGQFRIYHVIMK